MRKFRFLALMALLLLLVSGVASAQNQTTVRLWTGSSSPAEDKALQDRIAAFEKANPDIKVDLVISPDYGTQIQSAFASGDYPEVFYVGQDDFQTWRDSGVLANGNDKIEKPDDIYPGLREAFSYEGQLYCPAKDFSTLALLYNKDLFDKAGVKYPTVDWTWDDLKAAAKKLTSGDVVGMSVAPDRNRWFAFFYANGGQFFDKDGNVAVNSKEAIDSLDYYASFVTEKIGNTPKALNSGWNGEAFGQGKAAMTVEGNWAIGYLADTFPKLNWGVAEMPTAPSGKKGTLTFTVCWGVAANAKDAKADAAWKLVNFLTGEEGAMAVAEAGFGVMPARASASEAWAKQHEGMEAFVKGAEYAWAPVIPLGYADFRDTIDKGMDGVLAGTTSPKDLLDKAASVAEDIKKNG
jgi:multiple sugar transport system substrate-binding protein